jgi:hypothetical protein
MPDSMSRQTLQADLAWIDGAFVPGAVIAVGPDGRIDTARWDTARATFASHVVDD